MPQFLLWLIMSSIFSFLSVVLLEKRIPNPVVVRCGTCQAKMHRRPPGKFAFLGDMVWLAISYLVVWRFNPPILLGWSLLMILVIPTYSAINRTYYAFWRWRHPLRCGGGGHLKPVPTNI